MDTFPSEIRGYTPVCLCGRGAYGQVWLVVDAVGSYRALKIVSKSMLGGDWEREFKGLKLYQTKVKAHPNLIQIFHVEDCNHFFYYTMEFADNLGDEQNYIPATLDKYAERYNLENSYIVDIFEQLLDAVDTLHAARLVHRDIKPENIIFVNDVPKLSDIGLATSMSMTLSIAGTQSFVPPELLSGAAKMTERNGYETDIYALGKTLYCVFSEQSVVDYPMLPTRKLATPEGKIINRTIKAVCHPSYAVRLKTSDAFREALGGSIGFAYWMRSFLVFLWRVISAPYRLLGVIVKNALLRNIIFLALLIGVVWGGYSLVSHIRHQRLLSNLAASGMLSMEEERDYATLSRKGALTKEEQVRLDAIKEKIALQVDSVSAPEGTDVASASTEIRRHKLVYREKFANWDNWKFQKKDNLQLTPESIIFGDRCEADIILDKVKLPDEFELNFTLKLSDNMPSLRFAVYAPDSVDYSDGRARHVPPENRNPASFQWTIGKGGTVGPASSRQMAGAGYTLPNEEKPHKNFLHAGTYRFTIVKTGNYAKIYCDGEMLYSPVFFTWKGGKFRIIAFKGDTHGTVTLSDLSVFDIARKTSGKNEFREPVPVKKNNILLPVGEEESSIFPYRSQMTQLNSDDWKVFNPAAMRIDRNGIQFTDEVMLVFKHKLPPNFSIRFPFESGGMILMRFLKEVPETDNIAEAYWKHPGLTVIRTGMISASYQATPTLSCDISNRLPYLGPYFCDTDVMNFRKLGGAIILHDRYFILGTEDLMGDYVAFYIYGCRNNPIKSLEIKEEPSFDLSHFGQAYFDSIKLSTPVLNGRRLEQRLTYTGKVERNSLDLLLPGLAHYSTEFKPAIDTILKSLPPMPEKDLADFLDKSYQGYNQRNTTEEKHTQMQEARAAALVRWLNIPYVSALDIVKQRYPFPKAP